MRPTVSQYAQALEELSRGASDAKALVQNLMSFLKRRGESEKLTSILDRLEWMEADKDNRVSVTAVTAREVSPETKKLLTKQVEALFPGKKIELSYAIDKQVIGGVRFRSKELLYDATVVSELSSLKKILSNT